MMQEDHEQWEAFFVSKVNFTITIILFLPLFMVQYLFYFLASVFSDDANELWKFMLGPVSFGLLFLLFLFNNDLFDIKRFYHFKINLKFHRWMSCLLYGASVFLYMMGLIILVVETGEFSLLLVLFEGGGALPLYIYCAQFLFPPRPRLRFICSLLVIPVCVLWIGLLLLLVAWLGP